MAQTNRYILKPFSKKWLGEFRKQKRLQIIMIPASIWAIAMFYLPILGNVIAFQDYEIYKGFTGSNWVGLKHFRNFFSSETTVLLIRNTLAMSTMNLFFGTVAAVLFALMINEMVGGFYKRFIQTVSYLPYFVSMAVCAHIFILLLGVTGPMNRMLIGLGILEHGFPFLQKEKLFWIIITIQNIWKNVGWSAIIYLAAIAGISEEIYEAAYVDGAGRLKRIWYITIPGILPTIAVLLIMNSANIIKGGLEQQLLMFNPMVMDYAEVINTYVYKRGIGNAQYSFATAVGMFQSLVSVTLLIIVNTAAKRMADLSLW